MGVSFIEILTLGVTLGRIERRLNNIRANPSGNNYQFLF